MVLTASPTGGFWGCAPCLLARPLDRRGTRALERAHAVLVRARRRGGKTEVLASKLLDRMAQSVSQALPVIIGTKTPSGKATLEALLGPVNKPRRKARRKAQKISAGLPQDPMQGMRLYSEQDAPDPSAELRIEIPPTGGPGRPSSDFPYHKLKHEELNAIQARVLDWVDKDVNMVLASRTSTGKSLSAEIMLSDALARGGKGIFLSPLRAVSQEKYDDWTDPSHPWSKRGVEILTGDYQLTEAKRKRLNRADVIVSTSEMIDSKSRRLHKDGALYLLQVLCLVVDEAHLLTMEDRGDALEVGLMRFSKQNPQARLVLLSATMPNVDQLGSWLTKLNGKPTVLIKSEWRPTVVETHWPTYSEVGGYHYNESAKIKAAVKLIRSYPSDKWIAFVHSKKAGRKLVSELNALGEDPEFHSSDLGRDDRLDLEKRFRHGSLRIVVATSTLAYGCNFPARRTVVVGVHRGLDEVSPIDVKQEAERAGRTGLDPKGDAYVLIPSQRSNPNRAKAIRRRFETIGPIESTLNDVETLAFHLTAEISEGHVKTTQDAMAWHARSLAAHQGKALVEDGSMVSASWVLKRLVKVGVLEIKNDQYRPTQIGRISSWLYFSPFDVADWCSNFRRLIREDRVKDDVSLAWALGARKSAFVKSYIPKDLQGEVSDFVRELRARGFRGERVSVETMAAYGILRGDTNRLIVSQQRQLHRDSARIVQAVELLDDRVMRGLGRTYCELLKTRLQHGCTWTEADLVQLPGIGGRRARALVKAGIKSIEDLVDRPQAARSAVGKVTAEKALTRAREILGEE